MLRVARVPPAAQAARFRILLGKPLSITGKKQQDTADEDSPNAFLRGLLHATFQDANGYVEGLDAVAVERFRRRYDAIPSAG